MFNHTNQSLSLSFNNSNMYDNIVASHNAMYQKIKNNHDNIVASHNAMHQKILDHHSKALEVCKNSYEDSYEPVNLLTDLTPPLDKGVTIKDRLQKYIEFHNLKIDENDISISETITQDCNLYHRKIVIETPQYRDIEIITTDHIGGAQTFKYYREAKM